MPLLLKINASPRGEMSISRKLGSRYVHHWVAAHPDGTVVERDLMTTGVPYMDVDWIAGVYAPSAVPRTPQMQQALALSEQLIQELISADHVLICTPMYNFSVPAVLKSWIDYLIRPGLTFALAPGWPGLLTDKPTRILIATRDVHEPGGADDLVTPVIRRALSFIGIRDVASLLAGGSLGVKPMRPFPDMTSDVRAVAAEKVRAEFYASYPAENAEAKRQALNRFLKAALTKHLVAAREVGGVDFVWFDEGEPDRSTGTPA